MTDMQQRIKQEEERLAKLDPWKVMVNVLCDCVMINNLTGTNFFFFFFSLYCKQLPLLQSY